ncbi:MAG: lysozyme [Prochlorococcus sp. SP3034]|nr:lysozyme [Prochlorococcus sp. SP3034]|tara:strand:- start:571 stop:1587 length:1017 start_codon:yes stop_codon:yes gene_type:complete
MNYIQIKNLSKSYLDVNALNKLNINIKQGNLLGILGPNGAGKTTLLKILSTLISPDEGEVYIDNIDLINESREIRKLIGYVAQEIALDKILTGRELLDFQADLYHMEKSKKKKRIQFLIQKLEMGEWIDKKCGTYSGGMKRRIDLASGLLHIPKVLILDEPTVGLDIESRNIIWELLESLKREGMTIILSSHYLDEIDKLSDIVVIIDGGKIIDQGTPSSLKSKLGGERISLKVREFSNHSESEKVKEILMNIDGISQIIVNKSQGYSLNFVADKTKDFLPKLKVELAFCKFEIFSLTQSQPSLDDVYLQATGKTLQDAEISMAGKRDLKRESKQSMR